MNKLNCFTLTALSIMLGCSISFLQASFAADGEKAGLLPSRAPARDSKYIVYQDWQDAQRNRSLPIKIYLPQSTEDHAPYPVVIFSHGLGGSREAATYLGDYWSRHGYLCVFVQHPGSDSSVWQGSVGGGRQEILQKMKGAANPQNAIDRDKDIKFVLDELESRNGSDPVLNNKLNLKKIALGGHSFGAGTTLAIAGQAYGVAGTFKDDRIKAALYLCPPAKAGPESKTRYGGIKIPGLLFTGTKDASPIGDTRPEDRRVPFDGITSPHQYLVNFDGADHGVFGGRGLRRPSDSDKKIQDMVSVVSTKFLDATLKDDAAAWSWLDSANGAQKYLGSAAAYERK